MQAFIIMFSSGISIFVQLNLCFEGYTFICAILLNFHHTIISCSLFLSVEGFVLYRAYQSQHSENTWEITMLALPEGCYQSISVSDDDFTMQGW